MPRMVPESRPEPDPGLTCGAAALARADGDPAAADRGPAARLAGVDLDLAGRLAGDPGAFVLRQRDSRAGAPAPGPDPVPRARVSAGMATQLLLGGAQASFFVFLALYLQDGRGMGPLRGRPAVHRARRRLRRRLRARARAHRPLLRARGRHRRRRGADGGPRALAAWPRRSAPPARSPALVPGLLLVGVGIGLCYTPLTFDRPRASTRRGRRGRRRDVRPPAGRLRARRRDHRGDLLRRADQGIAAFS